MAQRNVKTLAAKAFKAHKTRCCMVSGTRRYKSHSWVTVTPCEKVQSTTDFKPVNETETKHSKCFLLVNRETQYAPMLTDSFQLVAGFTTSAAGLSGISRFSVTSGGSWSQRQKSYRLLGSFRGTTGGLQRWAPSCVRGGRAADKSTGHFNRHWILTNRGQAYDPLWKGPHHPWQQSTRGPQHAPSSCSTPGGCGAAHRSPAWIPAAAACRRDSLQFNNEFGISSRSSYSLHPLNSLES